MYTLISGYQCARATFGIQSIWWRCCVPTQECCLRSPDLQESMIPTVCEVLQLTHKDRNDHDHFAACLQLCFCGVGLVCRAVDLDVIVQGASAHAIFVRVLHCSDYVHIAMYAVQEISCTVRKFLHRLKCMHGTYIKESFPAGYAHTWNSVDTSCTVYMHG